MSNDTENNAHDPVSERIVERQHGTVKLGTPPLHGDDLPEGVAPEDLEGEIGAEGGSGGSGKTPTPFHPSKEDKSPLGSTDQHSNA
jgi:hypothetical protein